MPSRRKSTDMVKRRAKSQVEAELEEKVLSPQEQRRQMLLNIGVWFLILAFCMTSGIMCFSIGGQEKLMKAQEEAQQQDPVQADIDRWAHEVEQNPNDSVALANLGYYWGQKAQELDKAANKPAKKKGDKDEKKSDKPDKPEVTKEQALQNAHTYLDRALQAEPDYAFALQKYADLAIFEKNYDKAREMLDRAVKACEKPVPEGDDKEALEANALNQKGQAIVTLANLDAMDNRYGEAERRLDDLIREQPGNLQAFISKANIIVSQPDADKNEALRCYGEALKIAQSLGNTSVALNCWVGRSAIYSEMGDKEKAKKELEDCKAFVSSNPIMAATVDNMIKRLDGDDKKDDKKAAPADNPQPGPEPADNPQPGPEPADNPQPA
ncbi:tetratricopeptide repeat protein, partial [bacterium]|nr:tetratricopeptide repeat protein [bacterium]